MRSGTELALKIAVIAGGIFLCVIFLWWMDLPVDRAMPDVSSSATSQSEKISAATASGQNLSPGIRVPAAKAPATLTSVDQSRLWESFARAFGSDLQATYYPDGRLAMIQAGQRMGNIKPGFDPKDPQMAIARAREVLAASAELIGVRPELPLENPIARGSEESVQVTFKETHGGIEVAPGGALTLQLGKEGELLAMSVDYIPSIVVSNRVLLDRETVRDMIGTASSASVKVMGGRSLVWLTELGEQPQARHAYEFSIKGKQIVVDAQTGETLLQRDRRTF